MRTKRILIVDDVQFNLDYANEIIESMNQKYGTNILVDSAQSVKEARDKIITYERYDAMIVDMNLSDGTGTDVAKAALKKSEETRIAALTIYPSKYEDDRCFFDLFLKKPLSPSEYREGLKRLLYLDL
jgi:CheY-like chemotaxis protein